MDHSQKLFLTTMWLPFLLDFSVHNIYKYFDKGYALDWIFSSGSLLYFLLNSLHLSVVELHTLLFHLCTQMCQYPAQMETSGLLVEQAILKVVWRFVTTILGAQCVMTVGTQLMQMWPVDNLDLVNQVRALEFDCFRLQTDKTCWRQDLHIMPFVKVFTQIDNLYLK